MKFLVFFGLVTVAAVGILFWIFPGWDPAISAWFWDPALGTFTLSHAGWAQAVRTAGNWLPWLFAGPAFAALALKLLRPARPMFMPARAAVFLAFTMAIGPGLVVNGLLKNDWGRPRPVHVQQFGGTHAYKAWYEVDGTCPRNCSFVSGEGSLGMWMVAPASLLPPTYQPVGYAAALGFAWLTGGLRIAFGGHFFSDTVISQSLTLLIIALTRWFVYVRPGAASNAVLEDHVGATGRALRSLVLWIAGLLWFACRAVGRGIAGLARRFSLPRRGARL